MKCPCCNHEFYKPVMAYMPNSDSTIFHGYTAKSKEEAMLIVERRKELGWKTQGYYIESLTVTEYNECQATRLFPDYIQEGNP